MKFIIIVTIKICMTTNTIINFNKPYWPMFYSNAAVYEGDGYGKSGRLYIFNFKH